MADQFVSCGRKTNSGSGSTNFVINHGHAIRSTFAPSRVTHFMRTTQPSANDSVVLLTIATVPSECQDWIYGRRTRHAVAPADPSDSPEAGLCPSQNLAAVAACGFRRNQ